MGRCGGDGIRLHAYEVMKLTMKHLVPTSYASTGCVFPRNNVLIEPPHLRQDKNRPGDIYAMGATIQMKHNSDGLGHGTLANS